MILSLFCPFWVFNLLVIVCLMVLIVLLSVATIIDICKYFANSPIKQEIITLIASTPNSHASYLVHTIAPCLLPRDPFPLKTGMFSSVWDNAPSPAA